MSYYDRIKELAKDNGLRVGDLLALAPANDPFYTGRPSEIEAAQWFADLWSRFDYDRGVHLRRIHYQIVSQSPTINMPSAKGAYENTQRCWDYLNNAAKWARYLDLVPGEAFVDRRNPEAIINARYPEPDDWDYDDPTPRVSVLDWGADMWEQFNVPQIPELPALPEGLPDQPKFRIDGYDGIQQPYHIEVWAEKTTMNDVLQPVCQLFNVNLITGAGELSITAVLDFLQRVQKSGKPARILYISAFDPAGLGMPISVARKIEYYLRKGDYDADIRLEPVALTPDQVDAYDLPRVPVKGSDRRKAGWEAAYGKGQVELDALEALHPGDQLYRHLQRIASEIKAPHDDEINGLESQLYDLQTAYSETADRWRQLTESFQEELDAYRDDLESLVERGKEAYGTLYEELEAGDVPLDDYKLPEPELPPECDDLLYDSRRGYVDQIAFYTAYRNGVDHETA